jgi:hypothetical protein
MTCPNASIKEFEPCLTLAVKRVPSWNTSRCITSWSRWPSCEMIQPVVTTCWRNSAPARSRRKSPKSRSGTHRAHRVQPPPRPLTASRAAAGYETRRISRYRVRVRFFAVGGRMRRDRRTGRVFDAEAAKTRHCRKALFPAGEVAGPMPTRSEAGRIYRAPGVPILRLREASRRVAHEGANDEQDDRPTHSRSHDTSLT